ncbi:hypothetical protein [Burkholderia sp. MSMB0856]|uniref:hypothetical protein n=1 Tax=Burkholderia sp. MSMB0856 TaxID=1637869 RepID=UPI000AB17912|nr:hypothetical protein [Burkholderia sp. MSMB0856]
MTERIDQTAANGGASEYTWKPCLIAGEVCGETPGNPALNGGINKEDRNVSH